MLISCSRLFSKPKSLSVLLSLLLISCIGRIESKELLDSAITDAGSHDLVSYFDFKQNKVESVADGLSIHSLYSSNWTSFLVLGVDKTGRIVHMKLGVPRPLLDDEKVTTRGRDIVKSFVLASANDADRPKLKELADEIYVRGLDLQPIKEEPKAVKGNRKMLAFKVGKGPLNNGDNAIFLEAIPKLSAQPTDLFDAVMGRKQNVGRVFKNCRIGFANDEMKGAKTAIKLLWCESWDEQYYAAHSKTSNSKAQDTGKN